MKKKTAIIVVASFVAYVGLSVLGFVFFDHELKLMDDRLGMAFDD